MAIATYTNTHECSDYAHVTDASQLGLPPGEWPATIETEMGNQMPFTRSAVSRTDDGEIVEVIYRQQFGILRLHVFND